MSCEEVDKTSYAGEYICKAHVWQMTSIQSTQSTLKMEQ